MQLNLAGIGTVPVLGHGEQHLLDERRVDGSFLNTRPGSLGDDQRSDFGLDAGHGLLAGQRDFGQRVLLHVLGLGLRLTENLRGLRIGVGHDLVGLGTGLGHQPLGFGAALLQTLVVERPGQLLKFVFHSDLSVLIFVFRFAQQI